MTYLYMCDDCGETRELNLDMNDKQPKRLKCPKCKTMIMHRVFDSFIKVPFGWHDKTYDFEKRPREKRKYK